MSSPEGNYHEMLRNLEEINADIREQGGEPLSLSVYRTPGGKFLVDQHLRQKAQRESAGVEAVQAPRSGEEFAARFGVDRNKWVVEEAAIQAAEGEDRRKREKIARQVHRKANELREMGRAAVGLLLEAGVAPEYTDQEYLIEPIPRTTFDDKSNSSLWSWRNLFGNERHKPVDDKPKIIRKTHHNPAPVNDSRNESAASSTSPRPTIGQRTGRTINSMNMSTQHRLANDYEPQYKTTPTRVLGIGWSLLDYQTRSERHYMRGLEYKDGGGEYNIYYYKGFYLASSPQGMGLAETRGENDEKSAFRADDLEYDPFFAGESSYSLGPHPHIIEKKFLDREMRIRSHIESVLRRYKIL